jgi:hypothetical protein
MALIVIDQALGLAIVGSLVFQPLCSAQCAQVS